MDRTADGNHRGKTIANTASKSGAMIASAVTAGSGSTSKLSDLFIHMPLPGHI